VSRTGILIVEDEGIVARDIERQLADLGYEPLGIAVTGEDAIALAGRLRPRLVLMDIHLAGEMDGIAAAAAIRAAFGIPCVLLTAYATDEVVDRAKLAEPLGYVIKPFDQQSLRATIEIALHKDAIDVRIRQSESRYRAVVESAQDAIVTADVQGNLVGWSPSATRLFGYSDVEALGQPMAMLIPARHQDALRAGMRRLQSADEAGTLGQTREMTGRRKDGSEVQLELSLAAWGTAEGWFVTGMMRDITERKALEGQFLQAQKMEAVGLLAGGVAHEVNNLLTVMLGYTEVLAEGLHSETDRSAAAKVIKAGHRAAAITKQLLAYSRKRVVRTSVVDVNTVVADVSQLLAPLIGERIHLSVVAEPDLPAVRVDAGQIEQVLMNLTMNARDAMPDGGRLTIATEDVELDGTATFLMGPAVPGRYVRVSVVDTGVGMTEETRRRAVDPFFTTKDVGKGSGLGLSTVYGIVKQSSGYLGIDSEPGRGSTFSVYLPHAVADAAGRRETSPAAGAGAAQPPSD